MGKIGKKCTFTEGEQVIVYDFKSKLSSRGKIVKVLGHNTYSVDCGKGLQHVSGSALSKSSWQPREDSSCGDQMLTTDNQDETQDLVQEECDD